MSLGSKKGLYVYQDDLNNNWTVRLAADAVFTNSGLTVYDSKNPPQNFKGKIRTKSCRRVYAQGTNASATSNQAKVVKRILVCGTTSAGLYASNSPQDLTYFGVTITTTGRRGEKISF